MRILDSDWNAHKRAPCRAATVVQILAPDDMRGRATSFLSVFAQTTNATGAVIAGAGAALLGAPNAALVGCVLCMLAVIGTCWAIPQLWRYRSD